MIASEQRAETDEAFRNAQCRVLSQTGVAAQSRFADRPLPPARRP